MSVRLTGVVSGAVLIACLLAAPAQAGLTFRNTQNAVTVSNPVGIAAGDLDSDGDVDLVTIGGGAQIGPLLNNGTGTFTAGTPVAIGDVGRHLALGDVDADGDLDIAWLRRNVSLGTYSVGIHLNNGNAIFTAGTGSPYPVNGTPEGMAVGDVNHDGREDVAITSYSANEVIVRLSTGDALAAPTAYAQAGGPTGVEIADVTLDGRPDLVVGLFTGAAIVVRPNDGDGTFDGSAPRQSPVPYVVKNMSLADVDRDGDVDAAMATGNIAGGLVRRNIGFGTFQALRTFGTGTTSDYGIITDLTADGAAEAVFLTRTTDLVHVSVNGGTGSFGPLTAIPTGDMPTMVAAGDFNGDGFPDLATANGGTANDVSILMNAPAVAVSGADLGDVPLGARSAATRAWVTNTGLAPLSVTATTLAGAHAADYSLVTDGCTGKTVPGGASCPLDVAVTPSALGARTATIEVTDSATGSPHSVALSANGVARDAGPTGAPGAPGAQGAAGAQGPAGPRGARGPAGKVRCVAGKPKRGRVKVTCRVVASTGTRASITLSRRGAVRARARGSRLVARGLRPGTYRLTVRFVRAGRTVEVLRRSVSVR